MKYLLIGNPNVGKSSIFNLLTNDLAYVANYTGITVAALSGKYNHYEIIDLPGTYNIIPSSVDEGIVFSYLMENEYQGILNVVDVTHLKRNLHLTIQLRELGVPMKVVCNMMDELQGEVNYQKLSALLGCGVIPTSTKTKEGLVELKIRIEDGLCHPFSLHYPEVIEQAIDKITHLLNCSRAHALLILEGYEIKTFHQSAIQNIINQTEEEIIQKQIALSLKGAIFNCRRLFIENISIECVKKRESKEQSLIDRIMLHQLWGTLLFFFIMFSIYYLTFDLIGPMFTKLLSHMIHHQFYEVMTYLLINMGLSEENFIVSLILDGILVGVGGVLVFLPQIALLFLLMGLIESCGYLSRVAILFDTVLAKFNLNGRSIIPLLSGIGCNVPAVLASRTIQNKKERYLTMMIIPFMSCPARIPVYLLIITLFFPRHRAIIIMGLYLLGTVIALVLAKFLSLSLFKGVENYFFIELPRFRMPSLKNTYLYTLRMLSDFIKKAGQFILLGTIILWFLQYMGPNGVASLKEDSFIAYIGNKISFIFKPLGFGTYQASSSLIVGFFAKELIYSSMLVIYGGEAMIASSFHTLSAFSFIIFSLLYLPCLATVATIYQESKSLKYTLYTVVISFGIAYLVSLIIYQCGIMINRI